MVNDPVMTVTCDACGTEEKLSLTSLAQGGWDARGVDKQLKRLGWSGSRHTETICHECQDVAVEPEGGKG